MHRHAPYDQPVVPILLQVARIIALREAHRQVLYPNLRAWKSEEKRVRMGEGSSPREFLVSSLHKGGRKEGAG